MGPEAAAIGGEWDWRALRTVALREAMRVLSDREAAEDAAQDALIRAWRRRERCDTPSAPHAWVRAIARHEAYRQFASARAQREQAGAELEVPAPDAGSEIEARLLSRATLAALPILDRALLWRRYALEQTSGEIAREVGIPAATVRVRLHRAVKRVREMPVAAGLAG